MRVIHELESTARETYTGAIGLVSPVAGLDLNVAIRTFETVGDRVWLGVGGGIVADSTGEDEAREAADKAAPLSRRSGHPRSSVAPRDRWRHGPRTPRRCAPAPSPSRARTPSRACSRRSSSSTAPRRTSTSTSPGSRRARWSCGTTRSRCDRCSHGCTRRSRTRAWVRGSGRGCGSTCVPSPRAGWRSSPRAPRCRPRPPPPSRSSPSSCREGSAPTSGRTDGCGTRSRRRCGPVCRSWSISTDRTRDAPGQRPRRPRRRQRGDAAARRPDPARNHARPRDRAPAAGPRGRRGAPRRAQGARRCVRDPPDRRASGGRTGGADR